ncbi:hypothetical protein [Arthrobacter sp. NPDC058127]|uniref:hypothetical protein n=1 Tax=Arthrobacter sp. NPDC058127 TaxID=3346351 RepID=UPI0036E92B28
MSALVSGILLPGLLITAGIVTLSWTMVRMTVSIAIADEKIVLSCKPFYSIEVSISDVLAVTTAPDTSLSDGYGLRVMGKNTRGLLVGGPSIALETNNRRWIVSTARPEDVTSAIRDHMTTR